MPSRKTWNRGLLILLGATASLPILGFLCSPFNWWLRKNPRAHTITAEAQLAQFQTVMDAYARDLGCFPKPAVGLDALIQPPSDASAQKRWRGSYLKDASAIPVDPWGNDYVYRTSGDRSHCSILSYGADGKPGGKGFAADLEVRCSVTTASRQ